MINVSNDGTSSFRLKPKLYYEFWRIFHLQNSKSFSKLNLETAAWSIRSILFCNKTTIASGQTASTLCFQDLITSNEERSTIEYARITACASLLTKKESSNTQFMYGFKYLIYSTLDQKKKLNIKWILISRTNHEKKKDRERYTHSKVFYPY